MKHNAPTAPRDLAEERLLLHIDEAAKLLGIGSTLCYELVGQGKLPHVRLGRAVRVPRAALEAWIVANTRGTLVPQAEPRNARQFNP